MSRENVEIVERALSSFNAGDRDGALADLHPNVKWRDLQHAPDALESVRGVAAVRTIMEQWDEAFDEFTADVEEYVDAGDCVVCVTHWRATGKSSGLALDLRTADVYEFEEGKVARITQGYPNKNAALEAVRVRE
jgi:ketosteroid isomerase-like protein